MLQRKTATELAGAKGDFVVVGKKKDKGGKFRDAAAALNKAYKLFEELEDDD